MNSTLLPSPYGTIERMRAADIDWSHWGDVATALTPFGTLLLFGVTIYQARKLRDQVRQGQHAVNEAGSRSHSGRGSSDRGGKGGHGYRARCHRGCTQPGSRRRRRTWWLSSRTRPGLLTLDRAANG